MGSTTVPCTYPKQLAVVPLLLPSQLQVHGPLPLTELAVPVVHRLAAGAMVNGEPLLDPQVPLMGAASVVSVVKAVKVDVWFDQLFVVVFFV